MQMRLARLVATAGLLASCLPAQAQDDSRAIAADCLKLVRSGPRPLAEARTERFEGKVGEPAAACRGGEKSVACRDTPWVDWSNYWGAGDASSKSDRATASGTASSPPHDRNIRGIDGALIDLEYQRMELINFNLFDNATFAQYSRSPAGRRPDPKVWPEMRLEPDDPAYGPCDRRRRRAALPGRPDPLPHTTGICNDIRNPGDGVDRAALRPQRRVRSRPIPSSASTSSRRTATAAASRCSSPTRR